ncbi:barwin-like endoglucanase [Ceratobasidium sp. AG-I]|nr:barwin-like endoglucanase [Ceratobasidium sp. AG-I]
MFTSVVAALALAASVSRVAASPIEHVARGYRQDADLLEDYTPYHVRYIALNCQGQHNSQFFEDCCHPLLRWQKLSDRQAKCIPSASASSSAALVEPTAAVVDEDPIYDDCDDEPTSTAAAQATSVYVKPTPSAQITSKVVTREPTTTYVQTTSAEEPTTTHKPQTTKTSSSAAPEPTEPSSGGGEVFEGGFATFFTQNGNAGACGDKHDDYDLVVAADKDRYGDLNKKSDLCGKKVLITNTDNGKQVTAIIADACPTCKNSNSLDLSLGAFDKIGARETGMLPIKWQFV